MKNKNKNRILRGGSCYWSPPSKRRMKRSSYFRKSTGGSLISLGSININVIMVVFVVLAGMLYLHSINNSAVKGYQIRNVEKEISVLKEEYEQLKIKEAELKSLYYIEEIGRDLNMGELRDIVYIEETGPVALK